MTTSQTQLPQGAVIDVHEGPAVLFLHGTAPGTTAEANFGPLIASIQGHRLIAPDLLGFGASPKPEGLDYGPDLWVRQARELLDERGIADVVLVGNSLGARVATTLAAAEPSRVRGLVLLSTRVRPSQTKAQQLLRDYTPGLSAMETLLRECFVTDQSLVTPDLVRRRYEDSAQPGAQEALHTTFAHLAKNPSAPTPDQLSRLTMPTLLLHGREDRVVPVENASVLADAMPHANLHLLGGTGHWLQIERAATVNALVGEFLDA
jgi:pimeloyl-ACP methyl ester carboxylesterase